MRKRGFKIFFVVVVMVAVAVSGALAAQEKLAPASAIGSENTSLAQPSWLERDTMTGDWGGFRTSLQEHGITVKPRLTQFGQGQTSGDGEHGFDYGGKADVLFNADLNKIGLWTGFSMTVHAEYNFGQSVNGFGGTMVPVNTALSFPGIEGDDAFDLSSVYFGQKFGDSFSLLAGKINMIDIASTKPFMGGAGIDSFWNTTFVAPPSGTVPPYLFGVLLSMRTEPATYGLWIYDPNSVVNKTGFEEPFVDGVTFRGSVEFPVTIAGRSGHQGFVALYSTKDGTDLSDLDHLFLPPPSPGSFGNKDYRYYFAYTVDQYLYQSKENPKEGFGLFGQFGISDGNPNKLYWSGFMGVGGMGLIPGRSNDNWGAGYYYDVVSEDFTDSVASVASLDDEQGFEIFYNYSVTPWFDVGADLQIIEPVTATNDTAVFTGLRTVIRF